MMMSESAAIQRTGNAPPSDATMIAFAIYDTGAAYTQHIRELTASPTRALKAKVREMVGTAMCTGYLRLFAGSTSMAESAAAKAGLIGVKP